MPQFRQNPSVRPARPSFPRPTGCPQLPQKRLFSGTCGSASTALAGSRYGTGGISTSPAPAGRADLPLVRREPTPAEVRPLAARPEPEPAPAIAADAATTAGAGAVAAASPQTVQYPSSIVPPQLVQVLIVQSRYFTGGGAGTAVPIQRA